MSEVIALIATLVNFTCSNNTLSLNLPELKATLSAEVSSPRVCEVLKFELERNKRMDLKVVRKIETWTTWQNEICDMAVCSADRVTRKGELLSVEVEGIQFKSSKEIPGTLKREFQYWNIPGCPPYAPDCDL